MEVFEQSVVDVLRWRCGRVSSLETGPAVLVATLHRSCSLFGFRVSVRLLPAVQHCRVRTTQSHSATLHISHQSWRRDPTPRETCLYCSRKSGPTSNELDWTLAFLNYHIHNSSIIGKTVHLRCTLNSRARTSFTGR